MTGPVSISTITWTVQARLETRIGFSYEAIFENEDRGDEALERSIRYPTLRFEEGEDVLDENGDWEAVELAVTGGYADLVKWVLEVGEWTEVGMVAQIQSIEVDYSTVKEMKSGL